LSGAVFSFVSLSYTTTAATLRCDATIFRNGQHFTTDKNKYPQQNNCINTIFHDPFKQIAKMHQVPGRQNLEFDTVQ